LNFVHVLARVWSSWLMLLHQGEGWDIFFTHSSCHSNSTAYPFISLWMEVSKSSTYSQAFISTILGISALTSSWLDWLFAALVFDCFICLGSWAVGVNRKLSNLWLDRWELLLRLVNEIDILFLIQIHFLAGMNWSLWRRYLIKFRIVASIRWSSIISLTFLSSQLWLGWNPGGSVFVVWAAGMEATHLIVVLWNVVYQMSFGFIEVVLGTFWNYWWPASFPLTRSWDRYWLDFIFALFLNKIESFNFAILAIIL